MTTRPILAILLNAILPTCVMAADLAVAGSSTIYPVIAEAATVYDGAKLVVTQGGSGDGIKKAADGTVAVGMASRDLKEALEEITAREKFLKFLECSKTSPVSSTSPLFAPLSSPAEWKNGQAIAL